jgi:hypothetical protein
MPTQARNSKNVKIIFVIAGVISLFALYLTLTTSTAMQKSAHFDEAAHLMSGYTMLMNSDYRVGTGNMIFSQKLAALPLFLSQLNTLTPSMQERILTPKTILGSESGILGFYFLNDCGNNSKKLLFWGRMMMVIIGILTIILVFLWSRKIFGTAGAMISIGFMCTCPVFISLSAIIGADIAAAMLFLAATWTYWILLHKITPFTVFAFSFSSALLLITKISCLAFGPIALVLLFIRMALNPPLEFGWGWKPSHNIKSRVFSSFAVISSLCAASLLITAIIWSAYGLRYSASPQGTAWTAKVAWQNTFKVKDGAPSLSPQVFFISLVHQANTKRLFPEAFLFDLAGLGNLTDSRPAFFLGQTSNKGWLCYFPFTFIAKTPLPCLLASMLAFFLIIRAGIAQRSFHRPTPWKLYECVPLLVFITVFMAVAMTRSINIGHRHILPIYPFVFVLLGALACFFSRDNILPKLMILALLAGSLVSVIAIHPNHLAYISPIFGGPYKGYRLLVDSSLEWGQELPSVKIWEDEAKTKVEGLKTYFSYFGTGSPEAEGIHAERLPGNPDPLIHYMNLFTSSTFTRVLKPGAYLISATMLQPVYYSRTNFDGSRVSFCGPWNEYYEKKYANMRRLSTPLLKVMELSSKEEAQTLLNKWLKENCPDNVPENRTEEFWLSFLASYDLARFAKLASYLRNREPDGHINYSVYIFLLDEKELSIALGNSP